MVQNTCNQTRHAERSTDDEFDNGETSRSVVFRGRVGDDSSVSGEETGQRAAETGQHSAHVQEHLRVLCRIVGHDEQNGVQGIAKAG